MEILFICTHLVMAICLAGIIYLTIISEINYHSEKQRLPTADTVKPYVTLRKLLHNVLQQLNIRFQALFIKEQLTHQMVKNYENSPK